METATIPVSHKVADQYNKLSPEQQLKIQTLMSIWMKELDTPKPDALDKIMDEISQEAQRRGLTPEILEELLSDES